MSRSVAAVPLVVFASIVLLFTLSAEPVSAAIARTSIYFNEKSISSADAYAWAPAGNELVYATDDGWLWSVKGPDFAAPKRIVRIDLPSGYQVEQIVWSPDGQRIAIVSPRPGDRWDTIWLVNLETQEVRDLLPPGAPFGSSGIRALRISAWLPDGRITLVMHCGTGCLGLHAVQTLRNEEYWDFCSASGPIFWSPDLKTAVVQNEAEDVGLQGLGLVSVSAGITVAEGASYHRAQQECKSSFKVCLGCSVQFNSWFSDNRTVLYTETTVFWIEKSPYLEWQLALWNARSGMRKTLVADGRLGVVSPDGRYLSFIYDISQSSKQVFLRIMDLASKRVVASAEIPAVGSLPKWSPAGNYLAMFAGSESSLVIARFESGRVEVRQTKITGQELSWSSTGKYLAVCDLGSRLTILGFP